MRAPLSIHTSSMSPDSVCGRASSYIEHLHLQGLLELSDPEHKGTKFLQNIRNYSLHAKASHLKRQ